jgi:hypothetical protein
LKHLAFPATEARRGSSAQRYPERFAQEALGHNSKAVHRSYAKKAKVMLPSLNEWAAQPRHNLIPFDAHKSNSLQPHIGVS